MSSLRRLDRCNLMKTVLDSQQAITSQGPFIVAPMDMYNIRTMDSDQASAYGRTKETQCTTTEPRKNTT